MHESDPTQLLLENRHTGERLALHRVRRGDEVWLELKGSLPPHREGPPMHVHFGEDEEGFVRSGRLSVVVEGRKGTVEAGASLTWPFGTVTRRRCSSCRG